MKSVVATFESRADAERAARMLVDMGVERRQIEIQAAVREARIEVERVVGEEFSQ